MSPLSNDPARHFRAVARRSVSLSASLLPAGAPVKLVDLGLGGAGALVAEAILPGTAVRLALSAPQLWEPLELTATVVWARELEGSQRIGLRFRYESPRALRAVSELLDALLFA